MADKTTRDIGNKGEDLACTYLENKGWTILERNYFFSKSEIDIIARDNAVIVFIEVKLRSSAKYGRPEEYVTENKVGHVFRAAEAWMHEREIGDEPMRFDVIGILKKKNGEPEFTHIEDAFR